MDDQSFEGRYLDVLQNLEFGIIQVVRRHPKMSDWEALAVVEALMQVYRAEATGREARPPKLDPLAEETYGIVESMCEWRLGRGQFVNDEGEPMELSVEPITAEEMYKCLKRIRDSIRKWTKRAGRQGYLRYIDQFFPYMPDAEQ
jgi:hypothetical protein